MFIRIMNVVDSLVNTFGAQRHVASAAGVKQATVSRWRKSNVPLNYVWPLAQSAAHRGLKLHPLTIISWIIETELHRRGEAGTVVIKLTKPVARSTTTVEFPE